MVPEPWIMVDIAFSANCESLQRGREEKRGILLQIVSSRHTQETWVKTFQCCHQILSVTIWTVLVCWWKETDQVEIDTAAFRFKLNHEGAVDIWCCKLRLQDELMLCPCFG